VKVSTAVTFDLNENDYEEHNEHDGFYEDVKDCDDYYDDSNNYDDDSNNYDDDSNNGYDAEAE
jgi:hypothetical protein